MTKAPIELQELRRRIYAKAKAEPSWRFWGLYVHVCKTETLREAYRLAKRNNGAPGIDGVTFAALEADGVEPFLEQIQEELRHGTYRPMRMRKVGIPKDGGKERMLSIPTIRDRVVQGALRHVLEPIFEAEFAPESYGFRPGRSAKDALRRVWEWLTEGYAYVVDADLESYYDTIPREPLLSRIAEQVADGSVLDLIEKYLRQDVMENAKQWTPEQGTPQGAVLSPLLSNIYLDNLDHLMVERGYRIVRYADDFVTLCRSEKEAQAALEEVRRWTEVVGLRLHLEKTRIVDAEQPGGFDFLGYHFERGYRWPRRRSKKKFKADIRKKTKRTRGDSLQTIILDVNRTQRGWFEYYKHSHWTTFRPLDAWIRMRLRSILRKRRGGKGRGRGRDHNRWTNAYFAEQGLFSLVTAFADASQSSKR